MEKIKRTISNILSNPYMFFHYADMLGFLRYMSDEQWIKTMWRVRTGRNINLENPRGFNEKLNWIKLYDRNPQYTNMVDKYLVRDYIRDTIGEDYLFPLLGVWDNANDINFESLPNEFVLKCNHNSGEGMCVCKDKSVLNTEEVRKKIQIALGKNYYLSEREWPYKNVQPKVICEKFMKDNSPANHTGTLIDYKFHCFNGEPKFLYVGVDDISEGSKGELKLSFLDMNWETPEYYRKDHKPMPIKVDKPKTFDEMVYVARKLSKGIPFVRVDLYSIDDKVYFSEFTFFPGGGFGFFSPEKWENLIGDWIELPNKDNSFEV